MRFVFLASLCMAMLVFIACTSDPSATNAASCTIAENDAGEKLLRCPDGTEAPLPEAACRVEDRGEGTQAVVCGDDSELVVQEPVTCTVAENQSGYTEVVCSDGSAGALCQVTHNGRSTNLTCGEDTVDVPAGCAVFQHSFKAHIAYTVSCNDSPQTLLMFGQRKIILGERHIDSGFTHTCGIRSSGYPLCWGSNAFGQSATPSTEKFIDIAAAATHTCGLKEDNGVLCWGENDNSQLDVPVAIEFIQISAKDEKTCGLSKLGDSVCWGLGGTSTESGPFVQVAAGVAFNCALKVDGSTRCWGSNDYGQTSPPEGEVFIQISAGTAHACGLRPDGSVVCWGNSANNRTSVPSDRTFSSITAGGTFSGGILADDSIMFWGDGWNLFSQEKYIEISSDHYHACALTADSATCWGSNSGGQSTVPSAFNE